MGFLDTFKKMVSGKPLFEEPKESDDKSVQQPSSLAYGVGGYATESTATEPKVGGPKIIPDVAIDRVFSRINGQNMTVTCMIKNSSRAKIEIDKIRMLGAVVELDDFLNPGESNQYTIYNGARPNDKAVSYEKKAELHYKDDTGDYFCVDYSIEYKQESDGGYTVRKMSKLQFRDT